MGECPSCGVNLRCGDTIARLGPFTLTGSEPVGGGVRTIVVCVRIPQARHDMRVDRSRLRLRQLTIDWTRHISCVEQEEKMVESRALRNSGPY